MEIKLRTIAKSDSTQSEILPPQFKSQPNQGTKEKENIFLNKQYKSYYLQSYNQVRIAKHDTTNKPADKAHEQLSTENTILQNTATHSINLALQFTQISYIPDPN